MKKNILITGRPGVGKTTAIVRIAEMLRRPPAIPLAGFYTEEIRSAKKRSGFAIRTLNGRQGILASAERRDGPRVGKYRVDITSFESTVLDTLDPNRTKAEVFLVDEIGKMECYSAAFVSAVKRLLDSDYVVIATVAAKGAGLVADVKSRKDVQLTEITLKNRDGVPKQIARRVRAILAASKKFSTT